MNRIQLYLITIVLLLTTYICISHAQVERFQKSSSIDYNNIPHFSAKDSRELDKMFYTHLQRCNPVVINTAIGDGYSIFGIKNGFCSFEYRSIKITKCNLPESIVKQYSNEGLSIVHKLEENIKQNKNIYPDKDLQSDYINRINSDVQYCNPPMGSLPTSDEPIINDYENNLPKK